ncbi:SRPBCC family protein [Flavobacterium cerinum]|uniref:SRPBCC family protein n=1 Tax=Flavobacterium cerinum TaxID=2502784 RepID=A0ABY5IP75_9FLAO|nr:SRPBCC family protein [Flavobacterium cerinum]UUC43987.1 SRPBCC family protein [Flavobacterium cerinum]
MRVVKYIFLLLILAAIALTVYIATQSGKFDVQRTKVINASPTALFNYINDYKNWDDWGPWKEDDPTIRNSYTDRTQGTGASFSWTGKDGNGKMETIKTIGNDTIEQKIYFDHGDPSDVYWTFTPVKGGTKVTWGMKGEMGFMMKAFAILSGGSDRMLGPMFQKGLENIDNVLVKELKEYNIKINGLVKKAGTYYIKQSATCKIPELTGLMAPMFTNLKKFAQDNNISLNGSAFVIYNKYDKAANQVDFSVCLPVKEEIFTAQGSDIATGELIPYLALKTTLSGDYSHSKEAWDKTYAEITKNKWMEDPNGKYLEVYKVGPLQSRKPSEWITEIFIPITAKPKPAPTVTPNPKPVPPPPATAKETAE